MVWCLSFSEWFTLGTKLLLMKAGRRCMRAYYRAKVFTQPQCLGCVILRARIKTSYLGVNKYPPWTIPSHALILAPDTPAVALRHAGRLLRRPASDKWGGMRDRRPAAPVQ